MALTDLASAVILSKLADGWNFLDDDLEANAEGWDILSVTFMKDYGATVKTASQVAAEWPTGTRVFAGRDFWVTGRKPEHAGANIWKIALRCQGLNEQDRPIKITINGSSELQSFTGPTNIGAPLWTHTPGIITVDKGDVLEAQPSFTLSYVLVGSRPNTARVGTAATDAMINTLLGFTIGVRPSFWIVLGNPAFHSPHGWVLNDMPADILSGTDTPAALVTENWIYRRPLTP